MITQQKPITIPYNIHYTGEVLMTDEVTNDVYRLVIRDGVVIAELISATENKDT